MCVLFCSGVGVTVAVSFLYILLMWLFAPVIVWVTIIAVPLLVLASQLRTQH